MLDSPLELAVDEPCECDARAVKESGLNARSTPPLYRRKLHIDVGLDLRRGQFWTEPAIGAIHHETIDVALAYFLVGPQLEPVGEQRQHHRHRRTPTTAFRDDVELVDVYPCWPTDDLGPDEPSAVTVLQQREQSDVGHAVGVAASASAADGVAHRAIALDRRDFETLRLRRLRGHGRHDARKSDERDGSNRHIPAPSP
jgi:hypothetical protein